MNWFNNNFGDPMEDGIFTTGQPMAKVDKDGNVLFHNPIHNQTLQKIDMWMFEMADEMDRVDLLWCLEQIEILDSKFAKRFGDNVEE